MCNLAETGILRGKLRKNCHYDRYFRRQRDGYRRLRKRFFNYFPEPAAPTSRSSIDPLSLG